MDLLVGETGDRGAVVLGRVMDRGGWKKGACFLFQGCGGRY